MTVHLDLSQLVLDPRRSGIQRAERELIRHWPGPARLQPCRFEPTTGELHALPDSILAILCEDAPLGGLPAEQLRLKPHNRRGPVVHPQRLLNAELFPDLQRAEYYRRRPASCRAFWLIYDFLPWLDPDWFGTGSATRLMAYLRALRTVPDLAFISTRTRDDFTRRIAHAHAPTGGPIIPMGADGLGLERQRFEPRRQTFVMLGTIEPRKNAAPVMQAFQTLWREGVQASLVMIGGTADDAPAELALLAALANEPRFQHLRGVPDATVRESLRSARAMLFPSEGEGFGIPPLEALHAGIPAVVSAALPALADLPPLGQIRLDHITPETIATAIRTLLDDNTAQALWTEASKLPLPTWANFAQNIAKWTQA